MILRALLLFALITLVIACGPIPGGRLSGEPSNPPASWSAAMGGDKAFCEIESRRANPHSIQLECFVHEAGLHVQSHRWVFSSWWPTESWAEIWIEEPDLLVRIGDALYERRAVHVVEPALRKAILMSRGYDPVPAGIAIFRFDDRL